MCILIPNVIYYIIINRGYKCNLLCEVSSCKKALEFLVCTLSYECIHVEISNDNYNIIPTNLYAVCEWVCEVRKLVICIVSLQGCFCHHDLLPMLGLDIVVRNHTSIFQVKCGIIGMVIWSSLHGYMELTAWYIARTYNNSIFCCCWALVDFNFKARS